MSTKTKILVAEDDAGVRDLVRARLAMAGYDVHTATTGSEAFSRTVQLNPDAVILDINMPDLDGFGYLESFAANAALRRPPVLVLTARHSVGDVKKAVALGAKDYLTKPFNEAQLLRRVSRLLRGRQAAPTAAPTVDYAAPRVLDI